MSGGKASYLRAVAVHAVALLGVMSPLLHACGARANQKNDEETGSENCEPGDESCPCHANGTCNGNLSCLSQRCVELPSVDSEAQNDGGSFEPADTTSANEDSTLERTNDADTSQQGGSEETSSFEGEEETSSAKDAGTTPDVDPTGTSDAPPTASTAGTAGTGGSGNIDPLPTSSPPDDAPSQPPAAGNPAGGRCSTDGDCIPGMFCLLEDNEFFAYRDTPGQIPGGFCTSRCEDDPDICAQFGDLSLCITDPGESAETVDDIGYCMEYCETSDGRLKCASVDQVCLPFLSDTQGACTPLCLDDVSCGEGSFCDPFDGLCRAEPPAGKDIGDACSAEGECAGFCSKVNLADEFGVCAAPCTVLGVVAGCGYDLESADPPSALCFPLDPENAGVNDPGICYPTCDTNEDCNSSALECFPFSEELLAIVGRAGLCWPIEEAINAVPDAGG